MAGKFNLNQLLTDVSKSAAPSGNPQAITTHTADSIVKLSVYDLVPSDENFYSMNDIDELISNIELAGKVLQNLVVLPLGSGKYKVIAGHRRRLASICLVESGKPEYEFVPCIVEANETDAEFQAIREEIMLIATNSQREKTSWDKLEEVRRMHTLLKQIKKKEKVPGSLRGLMAKALKTSSSQIGRFEAIIKNLCPEFIEEIKKNNINISAAVELSGLSAEQQKQAFSEYKKNGVMSIADAKQKKGMAEKQQSDDGKQSQSPLSGQIDFDGNTHNLMEASETTNERELKPEQPTSDLEYTEEMPPVIQHDTSEQSTLLQEEVVREPEPPSITEPDNDHQTGEIACSVKVLESLRDYCQSKDKNETDNGSRVWSLDVDALEVAIKFLKQR